MDVWKRRKKEPPQGGVISPLLRTCSSITCSISGLTRGEGAEAKRRVYIVRYADDFVVGFQNGSDARIFRAQLKAPRGIRPRPPRREDSAHSLRQICETRWEREGAEGDLRLSRLHAHRRKGRDGSFHLLRHVEEEAHGEVRDAPRGAAHDATRRSKRRIDGSTACSAGTTTITVYWGTNVETLLPTSGPSGLVSAALAPEPARPKDRRAVEALRATLRVAST